MYVRVADLFYNTDSDHNDDMLDRLRPYTIPIARAFAQENAKQFDKLRSQIKQRVFDALSPAFVAELANRDQLNKACIQDSSV